jgi:Protein of unknown function (DUF2013)
MQLLVLKLLYLLFTNKKTSEYFYTNDLCVLVDVFLRELVDLDEDSESVGDDILFKVYNDADSYLIKLRHTYLRVLHPLLTKTQLRSVPYKRTQIVCALEGLIEHGSIRDINPTTKRLVERCLSGEWCVQLRGTKAAKDLKGRAGSPASDFDGTQSLFVEKNVSPDADKGSGKTLKSSKSVERLVPASMTGRGSLRVLSHNESTLSLVGAAAPKRKEGREKESRKSAGQVEGSHQMQPEKQPYNSHGPNGYPSTHSAHPHHQHSKVPSSGGLPLPSPKHITAVSLPPSPNHNGSHRRSAPPAPPKRRKPPAVPIRTAATVEGVTMTAIKTSAGKGVKGTGGQ